MKTERTPLADVHAVHLPNGLRSGLATHLLHNIPCMRCQSITYSPGNFLETFQTMTCPRKASPTLLGIPIASITMVIIAIVTIDTIPLSKALSLVEEALPLSRIR